LADVLREAFGGAAVQPGVSALVLAVWAVVTPPIAAAMFRWW